MTNDDERIAISKNEVATARSTGNESRGVPGSTGRPDRASPATVSLACDHELIRRWCGIVLSTCRAEDWSSQFPSIAGPLLSFCEEFVDRFHFRREERMLMAPIAARSGAFGHRIEEIRRHRDLFHAHLEGMRNALDSDEIGAATLFSWNALAAAGFLMRGMDAEERRFFVELDRLHRRGEIDPAFTAEDDDAAAAYAQAESTLLFLD